MIVVVAPGQGSQTPGFLEPWLARPGVKRRVQAYAEESGVDLVAAGTEWDADRIRDTAVAQPLIVAASIVAYQELVAGVDARPGGAAGHSVGELAALVVAGVLADTDAMRLVGVRGRAMAAAANAVRTGMSAVIGGDEADVLARLSALDLTPANYNGGGQIVAAGELPALEALAAEPPAGARVIPLQVAGAFHTRFMEPAVAELSAAAETVYPADPTIPLWTNRDGGQVPDGAAALELLVGQIANPVRWDLVQASLGEAGVTGIIELAPGGTLAGLAKRFFKESPVPTVAIKTPDDLEAARAMLEAS